MQQPRKTSHLLKKILPEPQKVYELPTSETITQTFKDHLAVELCNIIANSREWNLDSAEFATFLEASTQQVIDLLMDFEPTKSHSVRKQSARKHQA